MIKAKFAAHRRDGSGMCFIDIIIHMIIYVRKKQKQ